MKIHYTSTLFKVFLALKIYGWIVNLPQYFREWAMGMGMGNFVMNYQN